MSAQPNRLPTLITHPRAPVFVGRTDEIAQVDAFLSDVVLGRAAMLLVEAEAGGGKTSLLHQAIDRATADEATFTVFFGEGDPNDARALRCLAEALECRTVSADPTKSRIAHLLRGATDARVEGLSAAAQELIIDVVERAALEGPVLLVLDDLQWVDPLTLAVVGSLHRRLLGLGVGVLGALRPSAAVQTALKLAQPTTLRLGPFNDAEVAALAARATGSEPADVDIAAFASVRSNPFLISVLAANSDVAAKDATPPRPPAQSPRGPAGRLPGATVRPLGLALGRMTAGLPAPLRSFLEVAAIAGRDVDVDLIAQTLDVRVASAVSMTRDAVGRGWMAADGQTVRFRHDLFCEALVAALPVDRRDQLHLALGSSLAKMGHAPGRAAFHLLASNYLLDAKDVPLILRVAQSLPLDDNTAATLAQRAYELDPTNGSALTAWLRCLAVRRQHSEVLRLAEPWIERAGIDQATLFAIRMLATTSCAHTNGNDAAIIFLQRGIHSSPLSNDQRADYLTMLARLQWYGRDVEAVRASAGQALEISRSSSYLLGQVAALSVLSESASMLGDPGEALRHAEAAMALARNLSGPLPLTPELAYGTALVSSGRIREGLPVLARTLLAAERAGDSIALGLAHLAIQSGRLNCGDWDGFEADANSMVEVGKETGMRSGIVLPLSFEALAACRRAEFDRVPAVVARLRVEATIGDSHPTAALGSLVGELAEIEAEGRFADACLKASWLAGVLAPAGFSVQTQVAMEAARLAWICANSEVKREMAELTELAAVRASTPTRRAMASFCAALVDGSAVALISAARALAETERVWDSAVAVHVAGLAAAREAGPKKGGQVAGEAGRNFGRKASVLLDDAAARYEALGCRKHASVARAGLGFDAVFFVAEPAPPQKHADRSALVRLDTLSVAERRVLELVAAGEANADIAGSLFVSKRTVESHVASLYKKLGVTTRVALTHIGASAH